jgi:hypothetical protein
MTNRPHLLALGALTFLTLAVTACAADPVVVPTGTTEQDGLPPLGADGQAPSEDLSLEEAAPFLEAQGYFPAAGDLNGYTIGYMPDDVGGTPYDLDHTALAAAEGQVVPDLHEVERSWLADTVQVDYLVDDHDQVMSEREAVAVSDLYVSVMRRDDLTDIDAYYELIGYTLEEEFHDSPARELPDGDGHYNGSTAIFSPEPGVVVQVSYVDDAYWEEVEASDDLTAEGDPDEVLRIVEGITPA